MIVLTAIWGVAQKVFGLMPLKYWLIAAALAGVVLYHVYEVHEARKAGYTEGFEAANQQCEAREKAAKADYDKRVEELQQKAKDAEQVQATQLAIAAANYQKDIQDAENQRKRDVAAAQSGAIKLRVAGMCPRAPDPGSSSAPASTASGGDGAQAGELPPALTGRLLGIADDGDATVHQLTACQAVILTYLKGQS